MNREPRQAPSGPNLRPLPADPQGRRDAIRDQALALGFDAVGFAPAALSEEARAGLKNFLEAGYHGDMGWMAETAERRGDPQVLWPEARSVIVLAVNYGPARDPLALLEAPAHGAISVYAQGRDYHDVIKKRLKQLARWIHEAGAGQVKVFVDTAPVMEKPLAERAGLGWQGKHSNLVSRDLGSWFFLGEVFTDMELPSDTAERDHCGSCRRCLDACPTQAFPTPYRLDARRCISYLTIEHKGQIPREFRRPMANRIYGCDDCLAVCPWNKFATTTQEEALFGRVELTAPHLAELLALDDATFREVFAGSPIKRTGRNRFLRNVLVAAGNSGEAALIPQVQKLLGDPSPLVRGMAVWAFARLAGGEALALEASKHLAVETDPEVWAEWHEELGVPSPSAP